ncbi:hypothetical protein NC652_018620 [Populus alba x Populus x berolinensis]|nr:hypothetical protein NC652_018620 [Populus alba x Populus x berolinensis]
MPEKYHTNKETSSTDYSKHSGKMKDIGCRITSALHFQAVNCLYSLSQVEVVERNTSAETKSVPDVIILT